MTYQNEAARKVRKQKKTHRETRQRPQEVDGEASDTEPACDVHLSFTPCSHPQLPGALATCVRNKDQEVGLGKGGWASGCQSEVPLPSSYTFLRWSSHPGASCSPASICFQNSPEATTQA